MADRAQAELRQLEHIRREALETLGGGTADQLQPALLQPAGELLARYGEALRARACVVRDAHGGELFLLPDYTVPICRMHRERGGGAGRFVYAGPVFRLPSSGDGRVPVEEQQAGLEVFEVEATAAAEADVLCRTVAAVRTAGNPEVILGDAGIVPAILDSFEISRPRRTRLLRRAGQPQRLQALLDRFVHAQAGDGRGQDLDPFVDPGQAGNALEETLARRGIPHVGRRRPEEVTERLVELAAEREEPPLSSETASRIGMLLGLRGPLRRTLETLASLTGETASLGEAVNRVEASAAWLVREGVDPDRLSLDLRMGNDVGYYDGLVFEVRIEGCSVAGGGRYDRLARESGLDLCAVGAAVWIERLLGVRIMDG